MNAAVKDAGDRFATLKAWAHWAMLNPIDEHQEAHAKATNDLFDLIGNLEAALQIALGHSNCYCHKCTALCRKYWTPGGGDARDEKSKENT